MNKIPSLTIHDRVSIIILIYFISLSWGGPMKRTDGRSKPRKIHINLTVEVHQKLRILAAVEDVSVQELVFQILERELDRPELEGILQGGES